MIVVTSVGLANTGTLCGLDPFSPTGATARSQRVALASLSMRPPALAPSDPELQRDVRLWVGAPTEPIAVSLDMFV